MAEESIEKIQSERFDIDMEELKLLYAEMTKMNVQVSHTFDEMVVFHNSMVENKSTFLKNELPKILDQINNKCSPAVQPSCLCSTVTSRSVQACGSPSTARVTL